MDFRRLFDIFPYQEAKYPKKIALSGRQASRWTSYSTKECLDQINRVSAGLLDLGLKRNDKVVIISPIGNPKWNFLDFGMQQVGVVSVPIHATTQEENLAYIFNETACQYCIIANQELYQKIDSIKAQIPHLKKVFLFENIADVPGWDDLVTPATDQHLATIAGLKAAIHEDDLVTIIYTSGTTGKPKGVMLSHKNIVSNIKSTIPLIPVNCDKKAISFLPLSHIFERMVTYTYMAVGASVYYPERIENMGEILKEIKPHYFASVPRLLEKMYEGMNEQVNEKSAFFQRIFQWAIRLGEQYNGKKRMALGYWLKLKIADLLIFSHWRKLMGGRIEGVIVGAAALQPKLGRLFSAAGIEIREGYGLTETSPVISFNRFEPGGVHFGTVGIPIPGVEVKIDHTNKISEGEILVKGPNVMMGYFNQAELTAKVMSKDGWFRTGDVGHFVHKRFLQITDRKKDIFKTSKGKYIAPQNLETKLLASPFIEHCIILGFNRPFVIALILPSFPQLKKWCEENKVHWTGPQFMVINPKVEQFFSTLIDTINMSLSNHEQIKKFHVLFEPWSIQNDILTPTYKPKRAILEEKYQKEIEDLYVDN